MDYIGYVTQRVEDTKSRERILKDIHDMQNGYGDDWLGSFINNFPWKLPGLREAIEIRIQKGDIDPTKKHKEYDCYQNASDRFKNHNLDSFHKEVDETVDRLGISPEGLVNKVEKDIREGSMDSVDDIFKVMIELMSIGYFRHDLSR